MKNIRQESIPKLYQGENTFNGFINAKDLIPLPHHSPFGNLLIKYHKIIGIMIYVNEKVNFIFQFHCEFLNGTPLREKYFPILEEIVFLLRKVADEVISLIWLLDDWVQNDKCNSRIEIDCIGELWNERKQQDKLIVQKAFVRNYFSDHMDFLQYLNHISNAQKHSFINSDLTLIGADEPVINALRLPKNNLENIDLENSMENFYSISLREFIEKFNKFFLDAKSSLESLNDRINK